MAKEKPEVQGRNAAVLGRAPCAVRAKSYSDVMEPLESGRLHMGAKRPGQSD